ncbi:hypothetical protein [Streptomyces plicatus]|uniref:hypothetical protein n=1 Tax=Streptomyces plicatus TaxID=1922 RepID=UPI0018757DE3|nr:hypothetical protein [Streptomyces plicatus]GGZ93860.1 hypothetical protein GCM10010301_73580 [Streptomyces plicatus]
MDFKEVEKKKEKKNSEGDGTERTNRGRKKDKETEKRVLKTLGPIGRLAAKRVHG